MTAHTVSCRRLWLTYFPKIQSFIKVFEIESPFSVLGGWEFNQTVFGGREGFWEVTSTKEDTQEGLHGCISADAEEHRAHGYVLMALVM